MKSLRIGLALVAIGVGCIVNFAGDWIIGARVELFYGITETFSPRWIAQIFILPALAGYSVTYVYGLGGKWLCYLPPLIVRFVAYYQTVYILGVPPGASLMPLGWWGFFAILAIESAVIGGVLGEVLIKRIYGRTAKKEPQPPTDDTPTVNPP